MATPTHTRDSLIEELGLDKQNGATIGRLIATGGIGDAMENPDGTMKADVHILEDKMAWDPAVLVLPHGGELEITFYNDDTNTHCALVPSNGDSRWVWLPNYNKGVVNVELDGPGCYWYSSNIGNDEGRGLYGAIIVKGEVPDSAKLDRPDQNRPE